MDVLAALVTAPLTRGRNAYADLAGWLAFAARLPDAQGTVARSLLAGLSADRLGYAFASGYGEALRRLFEHNALAAPPGLTALAATETGGAHPRAITTRLEGGVLTGEKTFATLATAARELLVIATRGTSEDGKNALVVVRTRTDAPGVVITPRPETPFAPEIPHARVRFEGVAPAEVLPGDGYAAWLKPFRTIEDIHVLAATVGYLTGAARAHAWDPGILAELASLASVMLDLGARDASLPLTHVLLAGAFSGARRLVATLDGAWASSDPEERARWERDQPLLLVAESARTQRTDAAWRALRSSA